MDADEVHRRWTERTKAYSPRYYAYFGPDETSDRVLRRVDDVAGPDAAVLELGYGSGRHLAHLHDHGYDDLHGVDVNDEAREVMADAHPDLAADGAFYHDTIESVVPEFDDGRFDVVFSVETLQHVHPDNDRVFDDVVRATDGHLVTVENERGADEADGGVVVENVNGLPLYHRNWADVFAGRGVVETESERVGHNTLRVFERVES